MRATRNATLEPSRMFPVFREDLNRKFGARPITAGRIFVAFFEMSLWAIGIFRFGKAVYRIPFHPIRKALLLVYFLLYKFCEALTGIRISIESEIGPGLLIHNFGGVIIHGTLGENCTIVQGAQLISRADGTASGWPTLGDNVYVGSGAKLLGNIRIGNNVRIGANAVVMTDVPDDSLVMPPESAIIRGFYRPRRTTPAAETTSPATKVEQDAASQP